MAACQNKLYTLQCSMQGTLQDKLTDLLTIWQRFEILWSEILVFVVFFGVSNESIGNAKRSDRHD